MKAWVVGVGQVLEWAGSQPREVKEHGGGLLEPKLAPPCGWSLLVLPAFEPGFGVLESVAGAVGFQDVNPVVRIFASVLQCIPVSRIT